MTLIPLTNFTEDATIKSFLTPHHQPYEEQNISLVSDIHMQIGTLLIGSLGPRNSGCNNRFALLDS